MLISWHCLFENTYKEGSPGGRWIDGRTGTFWKTTMSTSSVNGLLSPRDVEVGPSNDGSDVVLEDDVSSDPFDIAQTKHVPVASLKRWRVINFPKRHSF